MSKSIAQEYAELKRGSLLRFRLFVADDGGWGTDEFVGGCDTRREAVEGARRIEAARDELIREGHRLASDPEMNLYFWLYDRDTIVASGSYLQ